MVKILKMLRENRFSTKDNDDNLLFGDNPGHWDQLGEVSESLEKRFEPSCSSNCSLLDIHKNTNTQIHNQSNAMTRKRIFKEQR